MTPVTQPHQCPQPLLTGQQQQWGLGPHPSSCWGTHDPSPHLPPFTVAEFMNPTSMDKVEAPARPWLLPLRWPLPPQQQSLWLRGSQMQGKSPPSRWWQRLWQKQGSKHPGGTRSNSKGTKPHLLQSQWRLESATLKFYQEQLRQEKPKMCMTVPPTRKQKKGIKHLTCLLISAEE